jgi:hypothetical protein
MNQKELTRAEWIAKLEELCILKAANGEEYAHIYADMRTQTDLLLAGEVSPSAKENDSYQGVIVYKEMTVPAFKMFRGLKLGDVLSVLATQDLTSENIRSRLCSAIDIFNATYELNHVYSSHKDEFGVKFTRVG